MSLNLDELALDEATLSVEVNGRSWQMRLFRSIGDYDQFIKLYEGRQNAYRAYKGSLAVVIPDELLTETVRARLPDLEEADGKQRLKLASENELMTATVLEYALIEPQVSWPEAVLLCRLNGPLALQLAERWNKAVTAEERENAKKN